MLSNEKDTLLLAGDEKSLRIKLRNIFSNSYNILEAENIEQATMLLKQNKAFIVLSVLDVGFKNRAAIRNFMKESNAGKENEIFTVMVTDGTQESEKEELAFMLGASEVISRSTMDSVIQRRIEVIINIGLQKYNFQKKINSQDKIIRSTNQTILDTLSTIVEYRNTESGNHILRIRRFTKAILDEVAKTCPEYELTENTIDIITSASALHDIGKISIPDSILNKPGQLTA